ncbi:uncharacterized protein [Coffea arabica]|uniref:Uncharacterized protein n=1 Tax=Coffea arabica TaxID=13443 RepID=A0A6P6UKH2_COFAR
MKIHSIVLPLLSVTLLLSLLTPSLGQQPKLCPVTFPLPVKGACGSDGDFRCIDEALKRFAASQANNPSFAQQLSVSQLKLYVDMKGIPDVLMKQ